MQLKGNVLAFKHGRVP